MNEIFNEIKELEIEAEKLAENAEKEQEQLIKKAKKDAAILLTKKEEELKKLKEEKIKDFQSKADSLKNENISKGKKELKELEKKSAGNSGKAVTFILEKFDKEI